MLNLKITFLPSPYSETALLGRTAREYLELEWKDYQFETLSKAEAESRLQAELNKTANESDEECFFVFLSQDMPLVTVEKILKLAQKMRSEGLQIAYLGAENCAEKIFCKSGKGTIKVEDDSFVKVDSAKNRNIVYNRLKERIIERHLGAGVNIPDALSVHIDDTVKLQSGANILPYTRLLGDTQVMCGATVEASLVSDCVVDKDASVSYSHLVSSRVGARATIGPFARLRGAVVESGCRVGDYVEIKASTLHSGAKAAHLTYIGDAEVGEGTNIGCGTVFCNYDGKNKHRTTVGKNCFVGANVNLVAPLVVGDGAFIAAGTTVTHNLEEQTFTIGRVRQQSRKKDNGESADISKPKT